MINNTNDLEGRILGTCMLEEPIGRGGMSVVYRARQSHPERYVAVKILLPNVPIGSQLHAQFLTRFQHEANTIAGLDHINIIPIYEYAEQNGDAYLVMPYLAGGSLHNLLARYGSLSLQETMIYIEQAAAALDYAHAHGVIHRDLKPGNFLLHTDGRLVLADFGIARIVREGGRTNYPTLTSPDLLLGTPDYMSPEMVRGEPLDPRSDIYELGIVLYQMLAGDVPFKDHNRYAVLMKRLQEPVPLLHPINASIPPTVDEVIQKATALNRDDRFASAGELARALQTAITMPHFAFEIPSPFSNTIPAAPTVPAYPATIEAQAPSLENFNSVSYAAHAQAPTLKPSKPEMIITFGKFSGLILVAICLLIIGGVLLVFAKTDTPTVSTSPVPPPPSDLAKNTVQQFYDDIDQWKYSQAFKLLNGNYCHFVNGYAATLHDKVTITGATRNTDGSYNVAITLKATELLPSGQVITTYQGYQVARQESDGSWKIVGGGDIQPIGRTSDPAAPLVDPSASPSQQAQAVIQQFYADINQGNYPGAYSLWGTNYQNSTTFCSFIQDFTHTKHDSVMFNSHENLADGTIRVLYTIYATEDNLPEVQSYYDIDLVGQNEYGMWKILKGSQTKS